MTDFAGKNVVVWGMARSGVAAAKLLCALGAHVLCCDGKPAEALPDALNELADFEDAPGSLHVRLSAESLPDPCDALVLSPGVPLGIAPVQQAQARGIAVLGELELAAQCNASRHVAAITGTNGKTTTTALLAHLCAGAGRSHAVGNIGAPWCEAVQSIAPGDYVAVEVSSYQLETVSGFRPRVSVLLNLTPDHLERHGTMQAYGAAKARIFENQQGADVLIYNGEDPAVCALAEKAPCRAVPFFATRIPTTCDAFLAADGVLWARREGHVSALCPVAAIPLPGAHNLQNALAAAAAAYELGVPPTVIAAQMVTFAAVPHRLQPVVRARGVLYINDSKATNPDAARKAIAAADRPTVLLLGGSDKGTPFDGLAAAVAQSTRIAHTITFGQTGPAIAKALSAAGVTAQTPEQTLAQAVDMASALAREGWAVLLSPACASFDAFRDFEHRGQAFTTLCLALPGAENLIDNPSAR